MATTWAGPRMAEDCHSYNFGWSEMAEDCHGYNLDHAAMTNIHSKRHNMCQAYFARHSPQKQITSLSTVL